MTQAGRGTADRLGQVAEPGRIRTRIKGMGRHAIRKGTRRHAPPQRDRRRRRPPQRDAAPRPSRMEAPPRPSRRDAPPHHPQWDAAPRPSRTNAAPRHPLAVPVGGLALLAVLTPLHGLWAVQLLMAVALLIVPGVILLRALRVPGEAVATHPIYVPAASILVLTFSGLAIDLIGPPLGLAAPLQAAPLLIALEFVCFGLLACSVNVPPETEIPWNSLSQPARKALAAAYSPAVSRGCAAVEQRP